MSNQSATLPPIQYFPEKNQLENTSNFLAFSDAIVNIARGYGLSGYLDGTIVRPAGSTAPATLAAGAVGAQPVIPVTTPVNSLNPNVSEWDLRDGRLASIIFQNVKEPRAIGINATDTASVMWSTINSRFNPRTAAAQTLAKQRFKAILYQGYGRFDTYLDELERLKSEANAVGCSLSDADLYDQFFAGLPSGEQFLWVVQKYGGSSFPNLAISLREYQLQVDVLNPGSSSKSIVPSALATQSAPLKCENCKLRGHSKERCYAPGGGWEAKRPAWYQIPKWMKAKMNAAFLTDTPEVPAPSALLES